MRTYAPFRELAIRPKEGIFMAFKKRYHETVPSGIISETEGVHET